MSPIFQCADPELGESPLEPIPTESEPRRYKISHADNAALIWGYTHDVFRTARPLPAPAQRQSIAVHPSYSLNGIQDQHTFWDPVVTQIKELQHQLGMTSPFPRCVDLQVTVPQGNRQMGFLSPAWYAMVFQIPGVGGNLHRFQDRIT